MKRLDVNVRVLHGDDDWTTGSSSSNTLQPSNDSRGRKTCRWPATIPLRMLNHNDHQMQMKLRLTMPLMEPK